MDILAEAIRDESNPHRVKYALELIKAVKITSPSIITDGLTDPEDIMKVKATKDSLDFVLSSDMEFQEVEIQSKLLGMGHYEYLRTRDIEEKEVRKKSREKRKTAEEVHGTASQTCEDGEVMTK